MKRPLALITALCIVMTGLFTVGTSAAFYCSSHITNGNDSRISMMLDCISTQAHIQPSAEQVRKIIRHFVYDSEYAAIGGSRYPHTNSAGYVYTVNDCTYDRSGINAKGCYSYAKYVSLVIYNNHGNRIYSDLNETAGNSTVASVRNLIEKYAQAGEHLEIGVNIHSVVYVSHDLNGFWFLDYYTDSDPYIRLCYVTYSEMAAQLNGIGSSKGKQRLSLFNANSNINTGTAFDISTRLKGTVFSGERALSVYELTCSRAQAKSLCEQCGGTLASITYSLQQQEAEQLLTEYPVGTCWLGGYNSGGWKWPGGEEFAYTNWASATPPALGSYVTIQGSGTDKGKWSVAGDSDSAQGFLMEAKLTKLTLVSAPSKTVYLPGEELDTAGLGVRAEYADKKTYNVPVRDLVITGFDSSACKTFTVSVTYGGKSVSFEVQITHDHVFEGEYIESKHPHRSYSLCRCGSVDYTNDGTYVKECPECNNTFTVYGDVNLDSDITTDDARLVLRLAVGLESGTPEQLAAADVDGEQGVTTDDARLLLRYVLNLDNLKIY